MGKTPLRIIPIPARQLRRMFNDGDYWGRAQRGELIIVAIKDRAPSPPLSLSFEPPGTRSQTLMYRDPQTGGLVAIVHQYLRPDGTLGAGGRPDPKQLIIEDIGYIPARSEH